LASIRARCSALAALSTAQAHPQPHEALKTRADKAHSAAVSAILGKAKILNIVEQHDFRSGQIDFSQASSLQDIGRKLLQSVGCFQIANVC
jgi:hypothetical protein